MRYKPLHSNETYMNGAHLLIGLLRRANTSLSMDFHLLFETQDQALLMLQGLRYGVRRSINRRIGMVMPYLHTRTSKGKHTSFDMDTRDVYVGARSARESRPLPSTIAALTS